MNPIFNLLKKINTKHNREKPFSLAFCEINLKNLEHNIQEIKKYIQKKSPNAKYLLPVKGNAYGTGMVEIAYFVQEKNLCEYLGVAHIQEAFILRKSGITMPILVLGQTSYTKKILQFISEKNIEISVSDFKSLKRMITFSSPLSVHLKIDLGMGRGGILENNAISLFKKILYSHNLNIKGIMAHFPVADSLQKEDKKYTQEQIQKFSLLKNKIQKICEKQYKKKIFDTLLFHISNSGGAIEHSNAVFDMVRVGIASYGYPENTLFSKNISLQPVVTVYSHFTLIKEVPPNFSIGYGRTYYTKQKEHIAILPVGYADGLRRELSNNFFVESEDGESFQSIGRISMDQSTYLLPKNFSKEEIEKIINKKIFLLGGNYNAKEMAKKLNTIPYEILINFGNAKRIKKIYVYK